MSRAPDFGNETIGLHGERTERQTHAADVAIGRAAGAAALPPLERMLAEAKLDGRAEQRRFVGIEDLRRFHATRSPILCAARNLHRVAFLSRSIVRRTKCHAYHQRKPSKEASGFIRRLLASVSFLTRDP